MLSCISSACACVHVRACVRVCCVCLQVGDRVEVSKYCAGIVRFKGETRFKGGMWYGVQLDRPIGKNNGTVGYVTYFRTKPKHGLFELLGMCGCVDLSRPLCALHLLVPTFPLLLSPSLPHSHTHTLSLSSMQ